MQQLEMEIKTKAVEKNSAAFVLYGKNNLVNTHLHGRKNLLW